MFSRRVLLGSDIEKNERMEDGVSYSGSNVDLIKEEVIMEMLKLLSTELLLRPVSNRNNGALEHVLMGYSLLLNDYEAKHKQNKECSDNIVDSILDQK